MTAVCGICVSNAVEENCYILMPGCGHVFDRACITNSLGVEYTCPECKNNYLLPSPYRPFQLANSTEFIEYKELDKHLMEANQTIVQLKEELARAHENLDMEQRSRKKSNESLTVTRQQLIAMQENRSNLDFNETNHLTIAVETEEEASINVDQGPSEIQATPSPMTPVPTATTKTCEKKIIDTDIKPNDIKAALLVHYNARIDDLIDKITGAQESQKKSIKQHLQLNLDNKTVVEKLHDLQCISSKVAASIVYSQTNAGNNAVKHKDVISKFTASVKKAKEMDDASVEEKQDKIKVYLDKIFELEKASHLADTTGLQELKATYLENDALLPNRCQMYGFSTVSRKLKKVKAKHAKLVKLATSLKQEKWQQKLEQVLTKSKEFQKKVDLHAALIEQAEQMNQELEAFLSE